MFFYFIEAFPSQVLANCDKVKKRRCGVADPAPKVASLRTQLRLYLTGGNPYIGGAEAERSPEGYRKAVKKATREGRDGDTCYDGFSRFSSTFADLLADMLRAHHDEEEPCSKTEYENHEKAVHFFANFFEDYRIESHAIMEMKFQQFEFQQFFDAYPFDEDAYDLPPPPIPPIHDVPHELPSYFVIPYFFDSLGYKNAGNGDFAAFRKRFRIRRALLALRAVARFLLMYKKAIEREYHPHKVRQRLEGEFRAMNNEMYAA